MRCLPRYLQACCDIVVRAMDDARCDAGTPRKLTPEADPGEVEAIFGI